MELYPAEHIFDALQRKMVFVDGPRQAIKTNNPPLSVIFD